MTTLPHADHVVDCRGALCPMPIIRLREQMDKAEIGQIVQLIATDPASIQDMPAFARNTGHELLDTIKGDGVFEFYFRKSAG
jgi:tRNA 2-thiouridine synthesizing protein A